MSEDTQPNNQLFDVVFFGILQTGKDKQTALTNLAKLFKSEPAKLEPLFAGGRKVIKGKVSEDVGNKYLTALENVGLVVKLEECEEAEVTPAPIKEPKHTATETATPNDGSLTMAEVGADVLEHPVIKEAQEIDDISFLSMAEVGADVLEHPVEVKPQVIDDISDISLEKLS